MNAAVAERGGRRSFFVNGNATNGHSLCRQDKGATEVAVEAISLGDFIKAHKIRRVDLLKMDCEGAEYEIMLNCPKAVLGKITRIAMECHSVPGHSPDELRTLLEESGFVVRAEDVPGQPGFCLLYAERK